ncbi:uncharacterized protein LOC111052641 isoform X2 [Nilaparvata lugens]|nr:uncharacterized protein LOC111052641 isoform X2 [Nilaparvata lugens]
MKIESKVHEEWRISAGRFHQNMYELFSSGPAFNGYHIVEKENLAEKIRIAILGCDNSGELTEKCRTLIAKLKEKIVKLSPEIYRKNGKAVVAIVYVNVLLNDDNCYHQSHVLFRVPKFVKKEEEWEEKEKEECAKFTGDTVEIEYSSGGKRVFCLKDVETACFVDTNLRVYDSCDAYKKNNLLPKGRMCLPQNGVYKLGEDGNVLIEILDTPCSNEGLLELMDASTSVLGQVGSVICVSTLFSPVGVVAWGGLSMMTGSCLYSCGRSVSKLIDRTCHDQELSLEDKEARHLWIDSVISGAVVVAGCKVLVSGFTALRANSFNLSSREVAAVWLRNSTLIVTCSGSGVLQTILTRVFDRILLNDWSDVKSFKNVLALFFNIFSPLETIKHFLKNILTISKSFFTIASSVKNYLKFKLDSLSQHVCSSLEDLMNIAKITGKFLFTVSVGLLDKRYKDIHDNFKDLLSGKITVVTFTLKMLENVETIWSWFSESFENAKHEYRRLCDEKIASNIVKQADLDNAENLRKMFFEFDNAIKNCEVDSEDKSHMRSLIKLANDFKLKLDADCSCNEFLCSVRVVCAFVVREYQQEKSNYDADIAFERKMQVSDFEEDKFNERWGLEKNVTPGTHFFKKAIEQTESKFSEMFDIYRRMAKQNAYKAIPSLQNGNFKQYLIMKPSEVTVGTNEEWLNLFKNLTGIAADKNVEMVRELKDDGEVILITPKIDSLGFVLASFCIKEKTPQVKGILHVCTSVSEQR